MEQKQDQKQWQGMERRQSSGFYEGLERRKARPAHDEQAAQEQKDQKQARMEQHSMDDIH